MTNLENFFAVMHYFLIYCNNYMSIGKLKIM